VVNNAIVLDLMWLTRTVWRARPVDIRGTRSLEALLPHRHAMLRDTGRPLLPDLCTAFIGVNTSGHRMAWADHFRFAA